MIIILCHGHKLEKTAKISHGHHWFPWKMTLCCKGNLLQPITSTKQSWWWHAIGMEFLHWFLWYLFVRKPVVATWSVGCFLWQHGHWTRTFKADNNEQALSLNSKIIHNIPCLGKISIQVTSDKLWDSSDKFSHVFSVTERVSQHLAFD